MGYKMSHPDTSLEIEVDADSVRTYESQGWETAPTAKAPEASDKKK